MGRGRGRQVIAVAKSSDCILMVPCPATHLISSSLSRYFFFFLLTRCSGPRRHQERNPARASGKGIGDVRHKDQHSPPEHNIQEDFRGRREVQYHCAAHQVRRVGGKDHLPRVRSQPSKRLLVFFFGCVVFSFSVLLFVFFRLFAHAHPRYRIHNADVLFREDASVDQLIDVIEGARSTTALLLRIAHAPFRQPQVHSLPLCLQQNRLHHHRRSGRVCAPSPQPRNLLLFFVSPAVNNCNITRSGNILHGRHPTQPRQAPRENLGVSGARMRCVSPLTGA
jgi:hypothetical protein